MIYEASVIICSHNPCVEKLERVMSALKEQTVPVTKWELLLIDNASECSLASSIDLGWHPNGRHVHEGKIGLTNARLRAIVEAQSDTLIFVDDDNVLSGNYIKHTLDILGREPKLGAIGGKSLPEFVDRPDPWFFETGIHLGLRDLGDEAKVEYWTDNKDQQNETNRRYPFFAPIGAGLVIRKQAAAVYAKKVVNNRGRLSLGRTGNQLTSGEDNDIVLTLLENGWGVGYFPQLSLTHIIPPNRLSRQYLSRLNYASSRSWVKVLDAHGIRPWKKIHSYSVPLRKAKAFFALRAWDGPASFIAWQGACGKLHAQSELQS